jgi:hypothetical protein
MVSIVCCWKAALGSRLSSDVPVSVLYDVPNDVSTLNVNHRNLKQEFEKRVFFHLIK